MAKWLNNQGYRQETDSKMLPGRKIIFYGMAYLLFLGAALGVIEVALRVKNASMTNYDIEMWRYAKALKVLSHDPLLGHEHRKNAQATLQGVTIRTNDYGLRGGPIQSLPPQARRILVLGASITLGWGVAEEKTLTSHLEKMFVASGQQVQVLNGGIGNYNAERYVHLFLTQLISLQPTDIVVHYFLRDAETLEPGRNNWWLRHSELAVTLWNVWHHLLPSGPASLEKHYQAVYDPQTPGFLAMKSALAHLGEYAQQHDLRLYLAMTPDMHNLTHYPFRAIHETMRGIAQELGYRFIDLLPALEGLTPEQIWAIPGDPHPNALGQQKMAEAIFPVLHNMPTFPADSYAF